MMYNRQPYNRISPDLLELQRQLNQIPDEAEIPEESKENIKLQIGRHNLEQLKSFTFGALKAYVNALAANAAKVTFEFLLENAPEFIDAIRDAISSFFQKQ